MCKMNLYAGFSSVQVEPVCKMKLCALQVYAKEELVHVVKPLCTKNELNCHLKKCAYVQDESVHRKNLSR